MVETKVLAVCGGLVIVVAFGIYVCSWKLRRVRSDDQEVVPVVAVQHVRQVSRALLNLSSSSSFGFPSSLEIRLCSRIWILRR
jgi:hypothetical protein